MDIEIAVVGLSALAHAGRLSVYRMLVQAGPGGIPAGEIARRLDVPPNTLSANLSILSHAGLVERRRAGRSIVYTARYDEMGALLAFLLEDCCAGSPEICAPLAALASTSACRPKERA